MRNRLEAGATEYAILAVAEDMRQTDRNEIWAADHLEPLACLRESVKRSDLLWTVIINDVPAAIGGVSPLPESLRSRAGVCWMLGTDAIKTVPDWFLFQTQVILGAMLMKYDYLSNFVDARNEVCLRWLKWLGFKIMPAAPYGAEQLMFHQVIREV